MTVAIPTVSIIIPLYNKGPEVERSVRSVLNQTVSDFELIVVNDGSTDKGPEVVRGVNDPRIKVIHQPNQGVSAARNRGLREANADLIAFLDADDEWAPDFLATILRLKKNYPPCRVYATSYTIVSANGSRGKAVIRLPEVFKEGILPDYFSLAAKSDPPVHSSASAVMKDAITSIGGFPVGVVLGEDLLTWAKLAIHYQIAYMNEPKAMFRKPQELAELSGRVPQDPDRVGKELEVLLRQASPAIAAGLQKYLALWYRMRAVIFIQMGSGSSALEEIRKAAKQNGMTLKLFLLALIARVPSGLSIFLLRFLKNTVETFRRVRTPSAYEK